MAKGDLLSNVGREMLKEHHEKGKDNKTYNGAAAFKYEMSYGASLAVDVGNHTAKQGCCRRSYVCPQENRKGIFNGDEPLLSEDHEDTNGYCRCMDKCGKYKAYEKSDEWIFGFPEKIDKKFVLPERYCGIANKA